MPFWFLVFFLDLNGFSSFCLLIWVVILAFFLFLCFVKFGIRVMLRFLKWLTSFSSFSGALELSVRSNFLNAWRRLPRKPPGSSVFLNGKSLSALALRALLDVFIKFISSVAYFLANFFVFLSLIFFLSFFRVFCCLFFFCKGIFNSLNFTFDLTVIWEKG